MPVTRECRRGVSLVELLVAMAILGLLGAAVLRAALAESRHAVAVAEAVGIEGGARTGLLLAEAELRELGGDASAPADLIRFGEDSIIYRAARGQGITCGVAPTQVRILDTAPYPFSGLRDMAAGRDSLLLFVEGDSASSLDDRWLRLPILAVGSSTCGGLRAIAVGTPDMTAWLPGGSLASVVTGGPVRTFEVMRLAEYSSGGLRWLGAASMSGGEAIQPVAGPLAGAGLTLEYFSGAGSPTLDPVAVRRIRVTLAVASERPVASSSSGGAPAVIAETLRTELFLRNAPR